MVEPIRTLRLPEVKEHEIVVLRLPDGRVVARTREELDAAAKPKEGQA